MPAPSFFNPLQFAQGFAKNVAQRYSAVDKVTGGWLPGGGTASPVTRAAQDLNRVVSTAPQAQVKPFSQKFKPIPGATPDSPAWDMQTRTLTPQAKDVLRQLGQNPDVTWDLNKTNPVAQLGNELGYPAWGVAHANPLKNQIYIPLSTGKISNLATLIHEAGHLNTSQRTGFRPPFEGIFGQALDIPAAAIKEATGGEFSPLKGVLAPARMAGGLLTAFSDAKEEDYAEKFTQDATKGMFNESVSTLGGWRNEPSTYARNLHGRGIDSFREGFGDIIPEQIKFVLDQVVPRN